jgi:hypothetical protein
MLVFVSICWAGVAVDGAVHLVRGDLAVPAAFLLAFAAWLMLWRRHATRPATAEIRVEA